MEKEPWASFNFSNLENQLFNPVSHCLWKASLVDHRPLNIPFSVFEQFPFSARSASVETFSANRLILLIGFSIAAIDSISMYVLDHVVYPVYCLYLRLLTREGLKNHLPPLAFTYSSFQFLWHGPVFFSQPGKGLWWIDHKPLVHLTTIFLIDSIIKHEQSCQSFGSLLVSLWCTCSSMC